jgi:hypothetical protein
MMKFLESQFRVKTSALIAPVKNTPFTLLMATFSHSELKAWERERGRKNDLSFRIFLMSSTFQVLLIVYNNAASAAAASL